MSSTTTTYDPTFAADVLDGLSSTPKFLSSKYFYDERGDAIFQLIMKMPEYYPTDCEFEIFNMQKQEILDKISAGTEKFRLIEFGAGDGMKTKILLRHFVEQGAQFSYSPIDISKSVLKQLEASLADELPDLQVEPLNSEYFDALNSIPNNPNERKVVLFLGSNIGNFTGALADKFLAQLRMGLNQGDMVLIGMDLKKDPQTILQAYNDPTGITRSFNLNVLQRINTELGGDFDIDRFRHWPSYDPITGETKSHLISLKSQDVYIEALGRSFHFDQWEPMQTELSQKYDLNMMNSMAEKAGFSIAHNFFDCKHWFVDSLWTLK